MIMNYKPIPTVPCYKSMPWGGTSLNDDYGKKSTFAVTGESWEAAEHFNGKTPAASGEFAGMDFAQIIAAMPEGAFLGKLTTDGKFPLLFKLIDARDRLSVQVHPDDAYAAADGDRGKTEMWIVMSAEEGAGLYLGFKEAISREEYQKLIEKNELESALQFIPCKAGDTFFLQPGLVHAIGTGLVIAEIQQSSDTTYRVYDWGRLGLDGKPRALHIEKALDVSKTELKGELGAVLPIKTAGAEIEYLPACSMFATQRIRLHDRCEIAHSGDSFSIVFCAKGALTITADGGEVALSTGMTAVVPAAADGFTLCGNGEIYRFSVPNIDADIVAPLKNAGYADTEIQKLLY